MRLSPPEKCVESHERVTILQVAKLCCARRELQAKFESRRWRDGVPAVRRIIATMGTMISRRQFLRGRFSAPAAPTAAVDAAAPKLAVIGVGCIAFAQNVVCRSCGDACGEAAIRFSPRLGGASRPEVLTERCTGCGACVSACPAGAVTMAAAGGKV